MAKRRGSRQVNAILLLVPIGVLALLFGQLTNRPAVRAATQTPGAPTAAPYTEEADLRPRWTFTAAPAVRAAADVSAVLAPLLSTPTVSATSRPSAAPTRTPTPTPRPMAAKAGNLRAGPGTNYDIVGAVEAGDPLAIVERNKKGDWYRLAKGGWIAAFLVQGAAKEIPVALVIPPTPRPRATATPRPARAITVPSSTPVIVFDAPTSAPARSCCKICTGSKACGNSCIASYKQCHQPPGCACQG